MNPRREAILKRIEALSPDPGLAVNRKWCLQTNDPDIKALLKKGLVKTRRDGGKKRHHMNKSTAGRTTYLVLAEKP